MIQLRLFRQFHNDTCVIGRLDYENHYFCETLELPTRAVKILGKTGIPKGEYKIRLKISPRTGMLTPWLIGVPNFSNIQIHIGNFPRNTDGCILLGYVRGDNCVYRSTDAFTELMKRLVTDDDISIHIL